MITIDKSYNGKKIVSRIGDVIKVQLAENPTTGYLWKIKALDSRHLHDTEKKYENAGEAVGAGGMQTFYVEVINQGSSELQIALGRPWENDAVDTFKVTIES